LITVDIHTNEIDPSLWNELVSCAPNDIHSIYQTYEWAQLMKEIYSVSPVFLLVYKNSKVIGGQLFFRKPILFFLRSYESQGGPLVIDENDFDTVETAVLKNYKKIRNLSLYTLTRPKLSDNSDTKYLEHGFTKSDFFTFLLNLNKSEKDLWDSFRRDIRRSVRKAEKNGLKFVEANTWDSWLKFYRLHMDHSNHRRIAPKSENFFKILFDTFLPKDMVRLFIAFDENQLVGGMLFLRYQNIITYYIGASDDNYTKCSPNDLIMWNSIQWGIATKIDILDLGDTWPDPKSHVYSIHEFKEKWGGQLIHCDFYIHGRLYHYGRSAVLNNKYIQEMYEFLHHYHII
jgi:lipid II:glycine glycyltransferase (peptidoglycan interpeptide bridge formation enzyme)